MAKLSEAMVAMLKRLDMQAKASVENPSIDAAGNWNSSGCSPELWIGTSGAPVHTCDALIRRGVAVEGAAHGFRTITINDAGRAALAG